MADEFNVKDWRNRPDTTTPINAVSLEDMETRLSQYAKTQIESLEASVANRTEVITEHYDDFTNKPDGLVSASPTADSGQTYVTHYTHDPGADPAIVDGLLSNNVPSGEIGNSYTNVELAGDVTRIGGRGRLSPYSLATSQLVLLTTTEALDGPISRMACHLHIGPTSWAYGFWETGTNRTESISTTNGSTTITAGADTFDTIRDVGRPITGTGIPANAYLIAVLSDTTARLSVAATATGTITATLQTNTLLITLNGVFAEALPTGEGLDFDVFLDYDASKLVLSFPQACALGTGTVRNPDASSSSDGRMHSLVDPRIAELAGPWACFETTQNDPDLYGRVGWERVWSDSSSPSEPTKKAASRMVVFDQAISASPKAAKMVTYAPVTAYNPPIPADSVWRVLDPVNLAITAANPSTGRFRADIETYLTMGGSCRVMYALSRGRAQTTVATTSGSATITGPPGTFRSSDTGKRIMAMSRYQASIALTSGSATATGPAASFTADDVGRKISGSGIPSNTTIATFVSATEVTLSQNATSTTTITAVIDAGIPGTAYTLTYVSDTQATLNTNATATGSFTVCIDDGLDYVAQDVLNSNFNGVVRASGLIVNLPADTTETWILKARSLSGTPTFNFDNANGRIGKLVLTPVSA